MLFRSPHAPALARECEKLERDTQAWGVLSARGAEGVAAKHSPEGYADEIERIYGRLVETPARP